MIGDLYSQSVKDDEEERQCFYEGNIVGDMTTKVTMNVCEGLVCTFSLLFQYRFQVEG